MVGGLSPLRIGLTGGIGSGKSTVAGLLVKHGAALVDTDVLARRVTQPGGAAIERLRGELGAGFIGADGGLDRARMREAAFAEPALRQRLEAIVHPLIGIEVESTVATFDASVPAIVFDVPLLVEAGRWRSRVDRVWVVDCSEAVQVARVMARSGWNEAAVRAVIAQQATRAERRAAADAVMDNEGLDLTELGEAVDALWVATFPARPE